MHRGRGAPGVFPPECTAAVQQLACVSPSVVGYQMTCWSVRSLATVVEDVIGEVIHFTSVAAILRTVDINIHQMEYCKSTDWTEEARQRAVRILWCYEMATRLWERNEVVLCLDEKPNFQILNHFPKRWLEPGRPRAQEFEYKRLGTANLLVGHVLHNGKFLGEPLAANDGDSFRPAFKRMLRPLRTASRIHVIMDNGSSHTAADTLKLFKSLSPRVRVLFTPSHASWLNQAENAIAAFSRAYLRQGSWESRERFIAAMPHCYREYDRLHAHPFKWSFTRANFHDWMLDRDRRLRAEL